MKLSVPFIPDQSYARFLKKQIKSLHSVYYALHTGPVLDARMRFTKISVNSLNKHLSNIGPVKKYCLLNSRFMHPKLYHDAFLLDQLLDQLNDLYAHSNIDGFVFSDTYFLAALASRKKRIIQNLEAVPGINCMIDSFEKTVSFLDIIENLGFLLPKKIILDRSLNRNLSQLETTGEIIRNNYPDIKIELLANEGCILHCPYKLAHDSQISFSNLDTSKNLTYLTNQRIGCHAYFFNQPERFFKTPFIRPEDVQVYTPLADSIKLCGRTLGQSFLTNLINAYVKQSYNGNLLKLMDATHWLSDQYDIDNKSLDPGFLKMVTQCTKTCKNCNLCQILLERSARKKTLEIKNYKDIQ